MSTINSDAMINTLGGTSTCALSASDHLALKVFFADTSDIDQLRRSVIDSGVHAAYLIASQISRGVVDPLNCPSVPVRDGSFWKLQS
ncbi:MAG: hypothetical protein ACJ716_00580 [Marmoricola sp.]